MGKGETRARQRAEIGRINQELKQELGGVMLARTDSHNRHVFELASVRVEMDEMEDEKEDALVRTEARSAVGPFAVTEIDTVDRHTYFCVEQTTGSVVRLLRLR